MLSSQYSPEKYHLDRMRLALEQWEKMIKKYENNFKSYLTGRINKTWQIMELGYKGDIGAIVNAMWKGVQITTENIPLWHKDYLEVIIF